MWKILSSSVLEGLNTLSLLSAKNNEIKMKKAKVYQKVVCTLNNFCECLSSRKAEDTF